jgi:hypothetical protein
MRLVDGGSGADAGGHAVGQERIAAPFQGLAESPDPGGRVYRGRAVRIFGDSRFVGPRHSTSSPNSSPRARNRPPQARPDQPGLQIQPALVAWHLARWEADHRVACSRSRHRQRTDAGRCAAHARPRRPYETGVPCHGVGPRFRPRLIELHPVLPGCDRGEVCVDSNQRAPIWSTNDNPVAVLSHRVAFRLHCYSRGEPSADDQDSYEAGSRGRP